MSDSNLGLILALKARIGMSTILSLKRGGEKKGVIQKVENSTVLFIGEVNTHIFSVSEIVGITFINDDYTKK